jgi:NDP-sugar pyrophosphorylase family protein
MSGNSERFTSVGYPIKQFIEAGNKYVMEHAVGMFQNTKGEDFIFIVKQDDISKYPLESNLLSLKPNCKIYAIAQNNLGPVYSISNIFDKIPDDEEIIVSYSDLAQDWDFKNFLDFCNKTDSDGCIVTHIGFHPHKLYNKSFAFLKTNGMDVLEIREKKPFTEASDNEPASNGIYYFKSGKLLKTYFKRLMDEHIQVNGEYYVTLPYNLMIKDGLKVTHYDKSKYICFGTPNDIHCFNAWNDIIKYNNLNEKTVVESFKFWNEFFNKTK